MGKVKLKNFYFFCFSWIVAILTIIIYYSHYNIKPSRGILAVIYSFFSSYTMIYTLAHVERQIKNNKISLVSIFLLITVLYNQNALTKFCVEKLFDGYIDIGSLRIAGSIFVDVIIIIAASKYRNFGEDVTYTASFEELFKYKKTATLFIYCMIIIYMILKIQQLHVGLNYSRLQSTIVNVIAYVVYFLVALNIYLYKNTRIIAYFPFFIVTVLQTVTAVKTGGKAIIIVFFLVVAIELVYLGCIHFEILELGFCISPIVLQIVTVITESISGRMRFFSDEYVLQYHAFRYDLSDFALSIALKHQMSPYVIKVIKESVVYAIPGYSIDIKREILSNGAYIQQLESMGFPKYDIYGTLSDFNDSIFSIGAQIGGIIGIPFMYFALVFFWDWLSKMLCKSRYGRVLIMVLIAPCALVECDLKMLLFSIRDIAVIIAVSYLIIKVLCRDILLIRLGRVARRMNK